MSSFDWDPQGYPASGNPYLQPIMPSPRGSPTPSPHGSPYAAPLSLGENYAYAQPGSQFVGMPVAFVPLPPSPSGIAAAYMPLPVSPQVSPRLGSIPLQPHPAYQMPQSYGGYPFDPYYFVHVNAAPAYTSSRTRIHPLLVNGVYSYLDFASHHYLPQTPTRLESDSSLKPLHPGYLALPASYPVVTHISIRCAAFKRFEESWKIRIDLGRSISVGDVLRALYDALQTRMTHEEWSRMSDREVNEASRAYTRRSRHSEFEKRQGVRRVDFLGKNHIFGGMRVVAENDPHHFMLLTRHDRN